MIYPEVPGWTCLYPRFQVLIDGKELGSYSHTMACMATDCQARKYPNAYVKDLETGQVFYKPPVKQNT